MYVDLTPYLVSGREVVLMNIWLKKADFENSFDKYKSKCYGEDTVERL